MKDAATIDEILAEARRGLRRLTAHEACAAADRGAVLIDTRSEELRRRQGLVPGARHHPLSVLEWRLCRTSASRDPDVSHDDHVIVFCAEGYSSSLAAARLQSLGFHRATDLIDGVEGWRAAGLPLLPAD